MVDDPLTPRLKQLLAEVEKSQHMVAAERCQYQRIAREQNILLEIGRLKIDAARMSLEMQIAARRSRSQDA